MSIFSRTRDIIAANVTELLDKAEDPAKMIRMIIMEMQETLAEVRAGAARTIADQKEMERAVARAEAAQASWTEKAELALSKGREDLATAALLEKSKAKAFADATRADIAQLEDGLNANGEDIRRLEGKIREAQQRQNTLLKRIENADTRSRMRAMYKGPRIEDAFAKFEVIERRADLAEGHADSYDLGGPLRTIDDEFADLRQSDGIQSELAAMKARLAKNEG
nr:phage shock protein PspA [Polymorphobacter sp.]